MSSKKEKAKELTPQKFKALRQAHLRQAQEYKVRVKPLVDFLKKHKLRFTTAHVGNERIEYFRIDEFQKLLTQHAESIKKDEKLAQLTKNYAAEFVFFKRPESIKIKYPKVLQPVLANTPDKKYASFRFDTTESKRTMTLLVIALVLTVVLFPIWPYHVKYGLWLISLFLLVVLVGIIIFRLALYGVFVIFNYHIWLFPNLFYSTGILDSFLPIIEINKGDKTWLNVFLRLLGLSLFLLFSLHLYMNPTFLDQTLLSTQDTISQIHDWGVAKIKNQGNFSQRALTNLEHILNETADVETQAEIKIDETIQINPNIYTTEQTEEQKEQQKYKEEDIAPQQTIQL